MFQDNNNIDAEKSQDFLQEKLELLQSNTFEAFKKHIAYREKYQHTVIPTMTENQKALWKTCATNIWIKKDGTVASVNSCRNRFCAICNWRAARKRYCYTYRAMEQIEAEGKYSYLFLTMTMKNCQDWELKQTISDIMSAVNRMQSTKTWKKRVKGYIRQTEVTYNSKKDTYHPHLHYIVAVPREYFTDTALYMQTWQWRELWEKSMRLDYYSQFKIDAIGNWDEGSMIHEVCEISKYQIKLSSVVETGKRYPVQIIAEAIKGRRMVAYGGIYADINKMLKEADKENAEDEIRATLYEYDENTREYIPHGESDIRIRQDKEYYKLSDAQRKQLHESLERARKNAIKGNKRAKVHSIIKDYGYISAQRTREQIEKELAEIETELIQIIDSEPDENNIRYDDYKVKVASMRRRYSKLYEEAKKHNIQ